MADMLQIVEECNVPKEWMNALGYGISLWKEIKPTHPLLCLFAWGGQSVYFGNLLTHGYQKRGSTYNTKQRFAWSTSIHLDLFEKDLIFPKKYRSGVLLVSKYSNDYSLLQELELKAGFTNEEMETWKRDYGTSEVFGVICPLWLSS